MSSIFATKNEAVIKGGRSVSVPLYVAGAIAQCAALTVVANQLTDTFFANLILGLTLLGFASAYTLRRLGVTSKLLRVASFGLAFLAFFFLSGRGLPDLAGSDFRHVSERLLISTLALTASIASFFLVTDESVAFVGVWGIAIVGLAATTDVNLPLILAFAIFLLALIFLLIHQHALAQARPGLRASLARGNLLLYQSGIALGLWGVVIALGVAVSIPLRMVGRNLSLASVVSQLKVNQNNPRGNNGATAGRLTEAGGQFSIGLGPIRDDRTPVMKVWTDQPRLWRGRTYDIYTGHGWMTEQFQTGTELPPTRSEQQFRVFNIPRRNDNARGKTQEIQYRVEAASATLALIYQAGDPTQVRVDTEALFQTPEGGLGAFTYLERYQVTSRISEATPAEVNASPMSYPERVRRRYLTIERLPAVARLVDEATAGKTGPYDRAEAIREFVSNRCLYTLDARRVPDERDAVDFFLNDSKEGYCDLYASSVAVLCRYAGLPARVATGFSAGEPDTENPGAYLMRESHRHAWAEVYFEGYGWLPFDATQGTGSIDTVVAQSSNARSASWQRWLRQVFTGPGVLVLVGVLGLACVLFWDRLFGRRAGTRSHSGDESPEGRRIRALYRSALHQARRRGVPYEPSLTAREHLERVRTALGQAVGDALAPLVALQEGVMYSPAAPGPGEVAQARRALDGFVAALRGARKD